MLRHAKPGRQQLANTGLKLGLWRVSVSSQCDSRCFVLRLQLSWQFASMRINGLHHCSPASSCFPDLHYPCMLARTHPLMLMSPSLSLQSFRGLILFYFLVFFFSSVESGRWRLFIMSFTQPAVLEVSKIHFLFSELIMMLLQDFSSF